MTEVNRRLEAMLPNQHDHQRIVEHAAAVPEVARVLGEYDEAGGTASLFEQINAICSLVLVGVIKPTAENQTPTEPTTTSA